MAKKISISEANGVKLQSNDVVTFRLKTDLNGEIKSNMLNFKVPSFPNLITTMSPEYIKTGPSYVEYYESSNEYRLTGKYKTYPFTIGGSTTASVRLSIQTTVSPTNIVTRDKVKITASAASSLSPLNGQVYRVVNSPIKGPKIRDLVIQSGLVPTSGTLNSSINSMRDYNTTKTFYRYVARVPFENYKNFLKVDDTVYDILIFAYTKTSSDPKLSETKYLLTNGTSIPISNAAPPPYSYVSDMIGKPGISKSFEDDGTGLIKIYVAIARYYKYTDSAGSSWEGYWLQKESFNPVWAQLVEKKLGASN